MSDQRTVLPGCMMPDGAEPCVAFQRLQADRDRLRALIDRMIADARLVGLVNMAGYWKEWAQEALDHD